MRELGRKRIYVLACQIAKSLDGISIGQAKAILEQAEGIIFHCHDIEAKRISDWMTDEGLSDQSD